MPSSPPPPGTAGLGRDLAETIIIDNSPHSYAFQPFNALPIGTFIDDPEDQELLEAMDILMKLDEADDVRHYLTANMQVRRWGSEPGVVCLGGLQGRGWTGVGVVCCRVGYEYMCRNEFDESLLTRSYAACRACRCSRNFCAYHLKLPSLSTSAPQHIYNQIVNDNYESMSRQ